MDEQNQMNEQTNTDLNNNDGDMMSSPVENTGSDNGSKGPTIGIVIIILVLILGGVYVFSGRDDGSNNEPLPDQDAQEMELLDQGTSTEIEDIEADALDTDLEDLDQELEAIEQELDEAAY